MMTNVEIIMGKSIMSSNDVIILDNTISQHRKEVGSEFSESDFFEIFTFDQILKNYELSYDDLVQGKVGSGDDGGIDGFFLFINDELVHDEIDAADFKSRPLCEVYIIQAKQSKSFSESVFQKISNTIKDLFDLSKDMEAMRSFYNAELVEKVTIFRESYVSLSSKHPRLNINYIYASKGDTKNIHPKIGNLSNSLSSDTKNCFSLANVNVSYFGAKELLELSRIEKSYNLSLGFIENPLSKSADNYVLLVNLIDYYHFVTDENKNLKKHIFDSNVRDYQGNVEVNKDILDTLASKSSLDFWWLNNGITILASQATVIGKQITLRDVQIINGLQTTNCIWRYMNDLKDSEETMTNRSVLIRILIIDDLEARDKIIKATNFQTAIPAASLKATDRIQRNIEDYFKANGLYYDRRKGYYKNEGKPASKIVSIPLLAQSLNTVISREPHSSRARPSSLLKKKETYELLFDEELNMSVYLLCAQLIKKVEKQIREQTQGYTLPEKTNLKFQITMGVVIRVLGKTNYITSDLEKLSIEEIDRELIDSVMQQIIDLSKEYMEIDKRSLEVVAKKQELTDFIIEKIIP